MKFDDESGEVGLVKRNVNGGVDLDLGDLANEHGGWFLPGRENIGLDKEMVGGLNR